MKEKSLPSNILMLTTDYPPKAVSGIGAHVRTLCSGLSDLGAQFLLAFAPPSPREAYPDPWVKTINTDAPQPIWPDLTPAPPTIKVLQANTHLSAEGLAEAFDLVHCHDVESALAGYAIASTRSIPLVLTKHFVYAGDEITAENTAEQQLLEYAYELERWSLQKADHIIAVSDHVVDAMKRSFVDIGDKVTVVDNSADTSVVHRSSRAPDRPDPTHSENLPVVLQVGRLHTEKGPDITLHAAHHISTQFSCRPRIVFAGTGPSYEHLQVLTRDLGLGDDVQFAGQLGNVALSQAYTRADIVVVPSRSDWAPVALCDALYLGCAVIGSNIEPIRRHITDGVNGLLFDSEDSVQLAQRIDDLLGDEPLRRNISENAEKYAKEKLTPTRMAAQTLDVYASVLGLR